MQGEVMSIGHDTVVAVTDTDHIVCELELRKSQKDDSNGIIQRLHIKSTNKSRFSIPLCHLRVLPLVHPISGVEVQRLECEFVMGYREGDRIMYVFNDIPVDLPVSPAIMASWSLLWQEAFADFYVKLKEDFCEKMFFVWEGNHMSGRSFIKSQVASLVERFQSWEVGEQVPHRQAYDGEDFGRLASQGVILGSGISIPWPS